MKKAGIFTKAFLYTSTLLTLVVLVTIALFYQQFLSLYNTAQMRQLQQNYHALYEEMRGIDSSQMPEVAQRFFDHNQSFSFRILDQGGRVLFLTPNFDPEQDEGTHRFFLSLGEYTLIAQSAPVSPLDTNLRQTAVLAFFAIMVLAVFGALLFAKQMTRPIKHLAADTRKMVQLLPVASPQKRRDEIGALAGDVHHMYGKLKDTIGKLETEIAHKEEMEEAQRYFFSAASHELKTPIAATSVLLEGMLENIGDYADHPKYLRECLKLMDAQSKTISEILEIVNLDGDFAPNYETVMLYPHLEKQLAAYHPLAEAKNLTIALEVPKTGACYTDKNLFAKVLSNVLLNAVQNTPPGGEIRIFAEMESPGITLCIQNSGEIDEALLPKLFDPFFRADKARNRKDGQNGLGLTIIKKALERMDVTFGLENTDEGVLFWMHLPDAPE